MPRSDQGRLRQGISVSRELLQTGESNHPICRVRRTLQNLRENLSLEQMTEMKGQQIFKRCKRTQWQLPRMSRKRRKI